MVKEIKKCKAALDTLLAEDDASTDWEKQAGALLVKIGFFQHERLIHLIVTMTMSLLTVITVCAAILVGEALVIPFALLFVLFLSLTAAYLSHYYKLENSVQELYQYYYKLQEKCEKVQNFC